MKLEKSVTTVKELMGRKTCKKTIAKCPLLLVLFFALLASTPSLALATPTTTITTLNGAAGQINNQEVVFDGEVVGDLINGDDNHIWVTLTDGHSSISVFMESDDAALINTLGRYNVTGTILEVTGVFHLACTEHDSLTDVHATAVSVVGNGQTHQPNVNFIMLILGVLLAIIGGLFTLMYHIFRERMR